MKTCKQCGITLAIDKFRMRTQHGKPYTIAICRECENVYNKYHHNKENKKLREQVRFQNPEKRKVKNEYQVQWRKLNTLKNREYHRLNIKKNVNLLTDSYITRLISKKRSGIHITQDVIEQKRVELRRKREKGTIKIPVRIDEKTIIFIDKLQDKEEAKRKFMERLNYFQSNAHNIKRK